MKSFVSLLLTFFLITLTNLNADEFRGGSRIQWLQNYQEALNQSKATSKPIILFFTGSDWCGWCKKLEEEVFNTADFNDAASDKYIFLLIDQPMYKAIDPQVLAQNKELVKKYGVNGYPTLVIIDGNARKLGSTGYEAGGGKAYADHLQRLVNDHKR